MQFLDGNFVIYFGKKYFCANERIGIDLSQVRKHTTSCGMHTCFLLLTPALGCGNHIILYSVPVIQSHESQSKIYVELFRIIYEVNYLNSFCRQNCGDPGVKDDIMVTKPLPCRPQNELS